jgi:hypothetical protein
MVLKSDKSTTAIFCQILKYFAPWIRMLLRNSSKITLFYLGLSIKYKNIFLNTFYPMVLFLGREFFCNIKVYSM